MLNFLSKKTVFEIMKITLTQLILIIILSGVAYATTSYSQDLLNKKISLSIKKQSLKSVIQHIEKQEDVFFSFKKDVLATDDKISLEVKDETLEQVLAKILTPRKIIFHVINNKQIILTRATTSSTSSSTEPLEVNRAVPEKTQVSGTVKDNEGGDVLTGVSVVVKGTTNGTTTNADGKYNIEVANENSILIFSFVGYTSQEQMVNNRTQIDVGLSFDSKSLEEIVVVGYGTVKKASVTGAITTMKSEDVKNNPVPNLSSSLAGRLSGVYVSQASGAPGFAPSIRIRSVNTWKSSGNEPLYVIDGVITDKRMFDALDYSEVDNITVLKDAASGAIYGARAANGVILVTTKRGVEGKFQLNYNYSYSFDNPSKIPDYMDARDMVRLNNYARTSRGIAPSYDAEEVAFFENNDPGRGWYSQAYIDPVLQRHSISASGGGDKIKYFVAGSLFDQSAFIKNADFKKYNFRSNIDVKLTKNLTGVFNVAYNEGKKTRFAMQEDLVGFDTNPTFGNLWGRLLYYLPNTGPKTSDGHFINPGWIGNPLAFVEEGGTVNRKERNIAMIMGLTYKVPFVDGLSVSGKFSPNYSSTSTRLHELKTTLYDVVKKGTNGAIYTDEITGSTKSSYPNKERLVKSQEATNSYQLNFSANFAKQFGKHNIDAIAVYEQSEGKYDYFYGVREGFPLVQNDQFWATSSARADSYVDGSEAESGRASYIGRILYNYDDKYFLNVTARRDGSMLFAPDYRWGVFPSVSAGWVLSNEDFFTAKQIDFLKLRGSWGLAGNDAVGGWKWSESYGVSGDYLFGTTPQPRVRYNGIVNKKLTWEKTSELNLGFDAQIFDRFSLSGEYFKRHNYDILDTRIASLPGSFGGSMPPENYGIVDGHGYEFELGYNGNAGDVTYGIKSSLSYSNNKVKLRDVAQNAQAVDNPNGRPTDYVRMLVSQGIIRTQEQLSSLPAGYTIYGKPAVLGALNFEDVNGAKGVADGKIDDYDRQVLNGKHALNPYTFGLNLKASWKGIGIDVFMQGLTGGSKLYDDGYNRRFFDGARPPSFWLDSWSPQNVNAAYPQAVTWDATNDHLPSTFWLKNGSFLRFQNINLSYSVPKVLCKKIGMAAASFYLSGANLITLSKYKFHDPSVSNMNAYPTMKTYTLGVNLSF